MKIQILNEEVDYFIEDTGRPKVLFIHGFTSYKEQIIRPILQKERSFDVVALDMVCHGKTTCNTPSLSHMFEITKEFIQKLNLDNLIVVGHSMGGPIALSTLELPTVKEALLLAPLNYAIDFLPDSIDILLPTTVDSALSTLQQLVSTNQSIVGLTKRAGEFVSWIAPNYKSLYKIASKEMLNPFYQKEVLQPLFEKHKNYSVLTGSKDLYVPLTSLEKVSKDTGVKLQTLEGVGHVPLAEANKVVLDAIETIVANNS